MYGKIFLSGVRTMNNRYLVLVLTEPTEGNPDRFNDYYENIHLDEVMATTGWSSAQRFKLVDELGEGCPLPYLAAYEAEAASPDEVIARLNVTRPDRQQSDTLNKSSGRVWVFEEIGPRHGA